MSHFPYTGFRGYGTASSTLTKLCNIYNLKKAYYELLTIENNCRASGITVELAFTTSAQAAQTVLAAQPPPPRSCGTYRLPPSLFRSSPSSLPSFLHQSPSLSPSSAPSCNALPRYASAKQVPNAHRWPGRIFRGCHGYQFSFKDGCFRCGKRGHMCWTQ
ncbi:hypothetical protein JCM1840_002219 [Sporobolomyces johnsonii]